MAALAISGANWSAWAMGVISLISFIFGALFMLWRLQRRVIIKSAMASGGAPGSATSVYRCRVTNIGSVGLTINRVQLVDAGINRKGVADKKAGRLRMPSYFLSWRKRWERAVAVPLQLPPGETEKKLETGDFQDWYTDFDILRLQIERPQRVKLVAVAVDTTGKKFRQNPQDALWIRLQN